SFGAHVPRNCPRPSAQLVDTPPPHQPAPELRRLLDYVGATRAARHTWNASSTNAAPKLASSPAGIPHDGRLCPIRATICRNTGRVKSFRRVARRDLELVPDEPATSPVQHRRTPHLHARCLA